MSNKSAVMSMYLNAVEATPVTAVRLGDQEQRSGWHEGVSEFQFYGDGESPLITKAGATWIENGCRFSCPLPSVLGLRQGIPVKADEPECGAGRPSEKLQRAMEWLAEKLQDGLAQPVKDLREEAKEVASINRETLDRAREAIGAKAFRQPMGHRGCVWMWQLDTSEAEKSETEITFG